MAIRTMMAPVYGARLMAMGGYGVCRFRKAIFGGVAGQVIRHAPFSLQKMH